MLDPKFFGLANLRQIAGEFLSELSFQQSFPANLVGLVSLNQRKIEGQQLKGESRFGTFPHSLFQNFSPRASA